MGTYYEDEKTALETQIGVTNCQNLVWITNRQQGKTTTLARFLAALAILAPVEGSLSCIYSTNLDRACELLKATKAFINFVGNTDILINNASSLTIKTIDGFTHTVAARLKHQIAAEEMHLKWHFLMKLPFAKQPYSINLHFLANCRPAYFYLCHHTSARGPSSMCFQRPS